MANKDQSAHVRKCGPGCHSLPYHSFQIQILSNNFRLIFHSFILKDFILKSLNLPSGVDSIPGFKRRSKSFGQDRRFTTAWYAIDDKRLMKESDINYHNNRATDSVLVVRLHVRFQSLNNEKLKWREVSFDFNITTLSTKRNRSLTCWLRRRLFLWILRCSLNSQKKIWAKIKLV